ncbi:amidase signature domain-containing protein [Nemania sp. FL0031]|nr:amidase signature domain-containing protein [Nemania sp. FL0031]
MENFRFSCGESNFSACGQPIARLNCPSASREGPSPVPVTVLFPEPSQTIDLSWLEGEKKRMLEYDDVLNESFFEHLIICAPRTDKSASLPPDVLRNCHACYDWSPSTMRVRLSSGPYVLSGSALYLVYRLYDDPFSAFMFGVTENGLTPRSYLKCGHSQIPVPSRLYYPPASTECPLRGKRIAIKDVFDLAGVPTSASCRDYQAFSGNAKRSANMVTTLIDAGAIIVGKTKTAQFASGENAHDWIDYQCPFNPRGDGYTDPDGSSTGSAAAIAAYDWLDYSIGTDTLGSMLGPAASQGIFGIRPTHGISDLDGVLPVSPHLDTVGFFARSITTFRQFGQFWYGGGTTSSQNYNHLLYASNEFEKYPTDVRTLMDAFVSDVAKVVGQAKTPLDIAALWNEKEAPAVKKTLDEYLSTTLAHIQLFDCYHNNLKFREDFRKLHGREPYANPMIRFKWGLGSRLTPEQYKQAREEQEIYRRFLREHVFGKNAVLVLPGGTPETRYRDVYDAPPDKSGYSLQGFGFLRDLYSFVGGLPLLVIPIGAVPRKSPVTGGKVEEPVSISLVGAPGTDCALMNLAESVLRESGRPMTVLTGKSLFGENVESLEM